MRRTRVISVGVALVALVVAVGVVRSSSGHGSNTTKVTTNHTSTTLSPPPTFKTTTGGVAVNNSGNTTPVTYTSTGGGPTGSAVPTVVNGVAMPKPGVLPTKAQVKAAASIPYTPNSNDRSGINWAAIDALAGLGYVQ
jgi:hypothetical protein